jgi:hypothetical protein
MKNGESGSMRQKGRSGNALLSALSRHLEQPRFRYGLYGVISMACLAAALFGARLRGELNFILSDGGGYYAYLPSVVFDLDLDLSNQIRPGWTTRQSPLRMDKCTELGYVKNKYPIGFALTLLPSFLISHWLSQLLWIMTGSPLFLDDGGYSLVYQLLNLGAILGFGYLTMVLIDQILVSHFRAKPPLAAAAILSCWLGTNYIYYYCVEPFMIHIISTFWVTLAIWTVLGISARLKARGVPDRELFLVVFSSSMAVICRFSNFFVFPFLVYLLLRVWKTRRRPNLWRALLVALVGMIPLLLQILVWKATTGKLLKYTYDRETFRYWASPKLWQTLFSLRHGLLTWSPLLLLSGAGFLGQVWKRRWRKDSGIVPFAAAFLVLWYLNSAWYGWWFGNAFGGRAFLELVSLFALGLLFFYEWVAQGGPARKLFAGIGVMACLGFNYFLMFLYISNRIPRGKSPI